MNTFERELIMVLYDCVYKKRLNDCNCTIYDISVKSKHIPIYTGEGTWVRIAHVIDGILFIRHVESHLFCTKPIRISVQDMSNPDLNLDECIAEANNAVDSFENVNKLRQAKLEQMLSLLTDEQIEYFNIVYKKPFNETDWISAVNLIERTLYKNNWKN